MAAFNAAPSAFRVCGAIVPAAAADALELSVATAANAAAFNGEVPSPALDAPVWVTPAAAASPALAATLPPPFLVSASDAGVWTVKAIANSGFVMMACGGAGLALVSLSADADADADDDCAAFAAVSASLSLSLSLLLSVSTRASDGAFLVTATPRRVVSRSDFSVTNASNSPGRCWTDVAFALADGEDDEEDGAGAGKMPDAGPVGTEKKSSALTIVGLTCSLVLRVFVSKPRMIAAIELWRYRLRFNVSTSTSSAVVMLRAFA